MDYFNVWLRFPYHTICKKLGFDTHNIFEVQFFLNRFSLEFTIEKLSNLVRKFKFDKLDIILKIKPGSDFICKYEKLKL